MIEMHHRALESGKGQGQGPGIGIWEGTGHPHLPQGGGLTCPSICPRATDTNRIDEVGTLSHLSKALSLHTHHCIEDPLLTQRWGERTQIIRPQTQV